MGPWVKFDDGESLRDEIERRTRDGETCAQIAAALNAKGYDVSNKTISRRRVDWGLRKRASPKTKGTIRPNLRRPRPKAGPNPHPLGHAVSGNDGQSQPQLELDSGDTQQASSPQLIGKRNASSRKAEITERTKRGETAEQICAALMAEGVEIKKGASSILRLQTYWGLIPYDPDRAFGRGRYKKRANPKAARNDENAATAQGQTPPQPQHYPMNCRFGSGLDPGNNVGISNSFPTGNVAMDPTHLGDSNDSDTPWENDGTVPRPSSLLNLGHTQTVEAQQPVLANFSQGDQQQPVVNFPIQMDQVDVAAAIVSAQMLIDLTSSAATAANELKNLLSSLQTNAQNGVVQPTFATVQAIADAKRKVAHGSQVALSLVSEAVASRTGP